MSICHERPLLDTINYFPFIRFEKATSYLSETAIAVTFIVLNIERWLKAILFCLFLCYKSEGLINFWLRYVESKRLVTPNGCILQKPESAMP